MVGNMLRHALCPLLLAAAMPVTALAAPRAAVHTVVIDGMRFAPGDLTVNAGDTVIWINKDPFPHSATSTANRSGATPSPATRFDSKDIAPGRSWKFVATRRGDFPYLCTLHRTMQGKLSVK